MKKVVLALTALFMLATPALAGITVDCTIDGNEVTVTYQCGDANLPRAFGLDIIADGNISMDTSLPSSDINDSDFYVFPGTIDVNDDTGDVDNYGTPVATFDANTMTIEMASLYADDDEDHNTPPPSGGTLVKFRVNKASDIHVDILENTQRGGVVMEDTDYNFPGNYVTCGDCESVGTYTISGQVTYMGSGLIGVTMNGLPSVPVTDGNGDYSDTVNSGWSGTVTPTKDPNYAFKPTNRVYSNVTSNQTNQNYCAYPGCWDYLAFCHADGNNDLVVNNLDFPPFRDGYLKSYPNATYVANPCGDFNRDGTINNLDFPEFRDYYLKNPPQNCTPGDPCSVYCP